MKTDENNETYRSLHKLLYDETVGELNPLGNALSVIVTAILQSDIEPDEIIEIAKKIRNIKRKS
jgi:hypothetical protein